MSGGCAAGAAHGLVRSATSDTPPAGQPVQGQLVALDGVLRRLRRMARVVKTAARCIADSSPHHRAAMVTLTYRDGVDWSPYHITGFVKSLRAWMGRRGYRPRYVWVLEKTQRGRPHYHVLVWLPRREKLPKPDQRGWWPHGLTRCEFARRAVGYIAKYASKAQDAFRVKGARLYGFGGVDAAGRDCVGYWRLSRWLRSLIPENTRADRVSFVGWVARATGEVFASPWRIVFRAGIPHAQYMGA